MSDVAPHSSASLPAGSALDSAIAQVLMDTIPDRIYFKDLQSRFVRNNTAQARNLGTASPAECVGRTDFDFFTREHAERAYADEQEIIRTGQPIINKTERTTLHDGTVCWVSTTKLPWRDAEGRIIGTFGLTRDITAAKLAGEKLDTERRLLRTIIDHIPARIYVKDNAARYLLNNRAHLDMLGAATQDDTLGRTVIDFFPSERGHLAMADDQQVIQSGQPILNEEKANFTPGGEQRWALTTKVPLTDEHGQVTGLVGISHDITRRKLAEQELEHRTAEMEADVRMARQLQEAFLARPYPIFPTGVPAEASALRFAHRYIAATTLGGDFFDLIPLSDTQCGVLVCDVMGHGVRAGLLTALIRGVVEEMGERAVLPSQVLAAINHSLCPILEQTGQTMFATAFYGVIDTAAGTLTYANAGHPPPLLLRSNATSLDRLALSNPEPAAGLIAKFGYTCRPTKFGPGDRLLVYTDGLIEAADSAGALFGENQLSFVLGRCSALSLSETCERIVQDVRAFCRREIFEDDVCIVAVESCGNTCALPAGDFSI